MPWEGTPLASVGNRLGSGAQLGDQHTSGLMVAWTRELRKWSDADGFEAGAAGRADVLSVWCERRRVEKMSPCVLSKVTEGQSGHSQTREAWEWSGLVEREASGNQEFDFGHIGIQVTVFNR